MNAFNDLRHQHRMDIFKKQRKLLEKMIPEWADPQVKKEQQDAMVAHYTANGYTANELATVLDARDAYVLWKAWQYDVSASLDAERFRLSQDVLAMAD